MPNRGEAGIKPTRVHYISFFLYSFIVGYCCACPSSSSFSVNLHSRILKAMCSIGCKHLVLLSRGQHNCEKRGKGWAPTLVLLFLGLVLIHFLHFHSSVLEPNFNLSLRQVQQARYLVSPVPGKIHVEEEFLLEL